MVLENLVKPNREFFFKNKTWEFTETTLILRDILCPFYFPPSWDLQPVRFDLRNVARDLDGWVLGEMSIHQTNAVVMRGGREIVCYVSGDGKCWYYAILNLWKFQKMIYILNTVTYQ